jgi:hypothetical protein
MCAQQMAWLGCAVKGGDGQPTKTSRAQQIEADGGEIRMPGLQAPYLLQILQSAGLCLQGAMGPVALTSAELVAWCAGMGRRLASWEFGAILAASRAYCNQLQSESDTPPFGSISDLSDPSVISKRIARSLSSLARPVKRNKK